MVRTIVFLALTGAGVVAWLYWRQAQPVPPIVTGFVEADEIRVGSRVGGRVAEVLVEEGDRVKAGQPIFRIAPFDLEQRLSQAQAELAGYKAEHERLKAGFRVEEIAQARARRDQAAATLDKLVAGPRPGEIAIARERVKIGEANLDLAQSEYERLARLREEDSAAAVEFDEAVRMRRQRESELAAAKEEQALLEEGTRAEEIAAARASMAEAEAALQLLEAGSRVEDIAKAEAQVAAAEAQVNVIQSQMDELVVESPCECVVEAIELQPGDLAAANAPSVSLLDTSRMWVRTYVPQLHLDRVRLGLKVPVSIDALPDLKSTGEVSFIATDGEFTPRNIQTPEERSKQVFRMKVRLDQHLDRLRAGMSADVLLQEAARP